MPINCLTVILKPRAAGYVWLCHCFNFKQRLNELSLQVNQLNNDFFFFFWKRFLNRWLHAFVHPEAHKSATRRKDKAIPLIKWHLEKERKTNLISLSPRFTARWWSSRFEQREAHELTNHRDALCHSWHANLRRTVLSPRQIILVPRFWHSTTLGSNVSTPARESGE